MLPQLRKVRTVRAFHCLLSTMLAFTGCGTASTSHVQQGNAAMSGGTPTIRREYTPQEDDPSTTNDESNDKLVGYFGTMTVLATSEQSGNQYTLDADISGSILTRLYFPKGGWVDFPDCELDGGFCGECEDEEGRLWTIEGEASGLPSSSVVEEGGTDEASTDGDQDASDDGSDPPDPDDPGTRYSPISL